MRTALARSPDPIGTHCFSRTTKRKPRASGPGRWKRHFRNTPSATDEMLARERRFALACRWIAFVECGIIHAKDGEIVIRRIGVFPLVSRQDSLKIRHTAFIGFVH